MILPFYSATQAVNSIIYYFLFQLVMALGETPVMSRFILIHELIAYKSCYITNGKWILWPNLKVEMAVYLAILLIYFCST